MRSFLGSIGYSLGQMPPDRYSFMFPRLLMFSLFHGILKSRTIALSSCWTFFIFAPGVHIISMTSRRYIALDIGLHAGLMAV